MLIIKLQFLVYIVQYSYVNSAVSLSFILCPMMAILFAISVGMCIVVLPAWLEHLAILWLMCVINWQLLRSWT